MNLMRRFGAVAMLLGIGVGTTGPVEASECKVEDWRTRHEPVTNSLWIEGAATCEKGRIRIRFYDNSGGTSEFLGVAESSVKGYIFETFVNDIPEMPESVEIKYSIEVR